MDNVVMEKKATELVARLKTDDDYFQKDFALDMDKLISNASYANGDECPECGDTMEYEPGHPGSYDDPPEPGCIWCECGSCYDLDWSRGDSEEEPDPRDDGKLTLTERNR
jgi:hypothetical protein